MLSPLTFMDNQDFENRRKHPRVREDLNVLITILYSPEDESLTGHEFECHTKDISFQGMCILSPINIQHGLKLELQIQVEDPRLSFSFTGIVIWCSYNDEIHEYEVGIQFMESNEIPVQWKKLVIDLIVKY